mgnify:CR=1 FL=1
MIKKDAIRFELIMDAGNGAQKAGDILIKSFAQSGHFVYIEPIIPAEISPPKRTPHSMSGVIIRVSSSPLSNIGSTTDIMLVEHEILLERRLKDHDYEAGATVLLDMGFQKRAKDAYADVLAHAEECGLKVIGFDIYEEANDLIKELNGNGKNMYYLGLLTYLFEGDPDELKALIQETFKKIPKEKLDKNLAIFDCAYQHAVELNLETSYIKKAKAEDDNILLDGNTALSMGIIDAGIKLFSGYPITPASTIMHTLAKTFPAYGGVLHQAEDEISAIGVVLGSYFSGVPAITATSGPGLSLKQEFIGLSSVSEVPCIVVDVQRGGPSTGLPTRTEQTDLFAAAFGSHGDNAKIVLSIANVKDAFYVPHIARYLAEKLRVPVIILSDYMTSVSYRVLTKLPLVQLNDVEDLDDFVLERFRLKRLPAEIEMVKDNQASPGELDQMRRVTGLNTDQSGFVEYTSESNARAHKIRNEKINLVRKSLLEPERFGDEEGDVLVVAWGSCRGALNESISLAKQEGLRVGGMHLKMVYPLPLMLGEIFKKYKKVVTVEIAYADEFKPTPLATLLRSETLQDVGCAIAQATGRPLKPRDVLAKIKELTLAVEV